MTNFLDWGGEVPFVGFMITDTLKDDTTSFCVEHELNCIADHGPPTRWWLLSNSVKNDLCYRRMLANGFEVVDKADLADTMFGTIFEDYLDKVDIVLRLSVDFDIAELHVVEDAMFGPEGPPAGFLYFALGPFPLADDQFPELDENEEQGEEQDDG